MQAKLPTMTSGHDILWVDDIVDSGRTIRNTIRTRPALKTACIFKRFGMPDHGAYCPQNANDGEWLVFPWESLDKAKADMEQYETSRK